MSKHKHHRSAKNKNQYLSRINKSARKAIKRLEDYIGNFPNDKVNAQAKLDWVKTSGKTKGRGVRNAAY